MRIGKHYYGRGGTLVVELLTRLGFDTINSIPGAQLLSIWDGVHGRDDIKLAEPTSEWDAVYKAIRYNFIKNKPAVVLNTVGPGCINELPAMATCKRLHVPVLFLTPVQPHYKQQHIERTFQGLNQTEILRPWCDHTLLIDPKTKHWGRGFQEAKAIFDYAEKPVVRLEIDFSLLFRNRYEYLIEDTREHPIQTDDPFPDVKALQSLRKNKEEPDPGQAYGA